MMWLRSRRHLTWVMVLLVAGVSGIWWSRSADDGADVERVVPPGTRIRVEVLNASEVRGLARRATQYLRDRGFDVVRYAGDTARLDSTVVLDRSNHPGWAALVSAAFGNARVVSRPDSARYLDVTVLVGRSWRPPAEPFHP
ncbi:MAG: LytR C-terminal domain-containing protein [Gemmatimonadota bacterium]